MNSLETAFSSCGSGITLGKVETLGEDLEMIGCKEYEGMCRKWKEMMFPPEEAKSRVVEINWGEEEGEDSAVQNPVRNEREIQEPSTPVLMVEARLETLEKSITFRKEALANLSEDLYSSRITYLVELRAMDMLKTSLTSLLEDLEELVEPDEQIRQMDLSTKNDF